MPKKRLLILGSTGSIGTQCLDVVKMHRSSFEVVGLAAGSNVELLTEQVLAFEPKFAKAATSNTSVTTVSGTQWLAPEVPLAEMVRICEADLVIVATVGWTGVEPTLEALRLGRDVALANKEVLVCAGDLVMEAARESGARIWPIDSEHNALMQCLDAGKTSESAPVRRMILTCSGGPYRDASVEEIAAAQVEQTLDHPTWDMGRKITVDSATLMNKGFEVIEAFHLFEIPLEKIQVIIHPQSIVHSIVEFVDGSMIAQMGQTDMRLPIQNVLTQPHRRPTTIKPLDLARAGDLTFADPDFDKFPCLGMAYESASTGGSMPCVLNAANEVAVAAHLDGEITCGTIPEVIREVLNQHEVIANPTLDDLRTADQWSREQAVHQIATRTIKHV